MASASMMTEAVKGKGGTTASDLAARIHALLTQDGTSSEGLGKLAALSGVREFPARVKCASLCWHTLNAALAQSEPAAPTVSTE
jgi:nitrogen fixation NifU-like protein